MARIGLTASGPGGPRRTAAAPATAGPAPAALKDPSNVTVYCGGGVNRRVREREVVGNRDDLAQADPALARRIAHERHLTTKLRQALAYVKGAVVDITGKIRFKWYNMYVF